MKKFCTPQALLGLLLIALMLGAALLALVWTPHDPLKISFSARLQPPGAEWPLGTDEFGPDELSRLMSGAANSLLISLLTVLLAIVAGPAGRARRQPVRHHPRAGPGLYPIGRAHRARHGVVAARERIHRILACARQLRAVHHVAPHFAELHCAADGAGDIDVRLGHPGRERAVLSRPGCAAAGADLGQYAGVGAALHGAGDLSVDLSRTVHLAHAAGHQFSR